MRYNYTNMTLVFDEDKSNRKITELLEKEEEELVELLSGKYNLEYVNLQLTPVNADALRLIPESEAREALVVSFALIDKRLKIAARNPQDEKTAKILDNLRAKGYAPELYITSLKSLNKAWLTYKDLSFSYESKTGSLEISSEEIGEIANQAKSLSQVINILNTVLSAKKSYRVSRILETTLAGALAIEASDIHFEPEESSVRLRYRLDGVLHDALHFDNETYALILSRIKLVSGLKLNIKKESQDGRISIKMSGREIEIRVSVLPGTYNESIVMRVLDPRSIEIPLEDLGINAGLMAILDKEMTRPNGMILTTGPTGSGKTTTLYAFLKKIYNPEVKIITIEDPVEYHLKGIVQTQVNEKGYNFAEGLRAAVRQDPDIIMIGEIRDRETAEIAINSALTGHLVFSTLHTNDAAGSFPRLVDLGVNPKVMSSAIRVAMAQRLARKLCPYCKKEALLEGEPRDKIETVINSIVNKNLIPIDHTKVWTAVGCDKCNGTGYKGRIGIYEAILMNRKIADIIEVNPNEREIWDAAIDQGLLSMRQDGVLKIIQGLTTLEELERVIALTD